MTTQNVLYEFNDDPSRCFLVMQKQIKNLVLSAGLLKNIISEKSL